jgi:sulfur-oxidizing protein SoxB
MVRVGGLAYALDPQAAQGKRITRMELDGKPVEAGKSYKVAGWAPVSEEAKAAGGEPVWDVVARHLKARKVVKAPKLNLPRLEGVAGNPGLA